MGHTREGADCYTVVYLAWARLLDGGAPALPAPRAEDGSHACCLFACLQCGWTALKTAELNKARDCVDPGCTVPCTPERRRVTCIIT